MCAHRLAAFNLQTLAPIRRLHSLSRADIDTATIELNRLSSGWSIDQHDDCDGDVLLILTPPDSDANAATFVLSRGLSGIQLARMCNDVFEALGRFTTITAALQKFARGNDDASNDLKLVY